VRLPSYERRGRAVPSSSECNFKNHFRRLANSMDVAGNRHDGNGVFRIAGCSVCLQCEFCGSGYGSQLRLRRTGQHTFFAGAGHAGPLARNSDGCLRSHSRFCGKELKPDHAQSVWRKIRGEGKRSDGNGAMKACRRLQAARQASGLISHNLRLSTSCLGAFG
jgi:hypothetical protein